MHVLCFEMSCTVADKFQGQCTDQVRVSKTHTYEQCQLNTDAVSKVNTALESIRKQIAENLSLYAYSAQISR